MSDLTNARRRELERLARRAATAEQALGVARRLESDALAPLEDASDVELTNAQRRELERLARKADAAWRALGVARARLARAAFAASEDGASVAVIAEAIELHESATDRLVRVGREPARQLSWLTPPYRYPCILIIDGHEIWLDGPSGSQRYARSLYRHHGG